MSFVRKSLIATRTILSSRWSPKPLPLPTLTSCRTYGKSPTAPMTDVEQEREFMKVFPDIIRELTAHASESSQESVKSFSELLQYNVPNGNKHRGLVLVRAYKMLESPTALTNDAVRRAVVMGWCVEMLQAFHVMVEDMIHESTVRRGEPCWYLEHGPRTLNDTGLIQGAMFLTLKRHFEAEPYYVDVLHAFNDVMSKVCTGQLMEKFLYKDVGDTKRPDLGKFTMKQYDAIVKYKTCYFRFQMPVTLAMRMCGMRDAEMQRQADTVLLEIGRFFQMQRDYLDCFGDPQETGFVGTDIANGRCSWLPVVALQRANAAQRKVLEEHYGTRNPENTPIVMNLYEELGLKKTYQTYEEKTNDVILTHIQQLTRGLPHELFRNIMKNIYGRKF